MRRNATATLTESMVGAGTGIVVHGSLEIANTTIEMTGPTGLSVTETGTTGSISNVSVQGANKTDQVGIRADGPVSSISSTTIENISTGINLQAPTTGLTDLTITGESLERGIVLNGTALLGLTETSIRPNASRGIGVVLESDAWAPISRLSVSRGQTGIDSATNNTSVTQSDLSGVQTAIIQRRGEIPAQVNFYGEEPRAANRTLVGPIRYGPFVTDGVDALKPPEEVTNFAYHLEIDPNGLRAISFPGGSNRTLRELLEPMAGVVWELQGERWSTVTNLSRTPNPLDAFVISAPESITATIEPNTTGIGTRELQPGWSLIGSPMQGPATVALANSTRSRLVLNRFDGPGEHPADDINWDWEYQVLGPQTGVNRTVSPHGGYLLYVDGHDDIAVSAVGTDTLSRYQNAINLADLASMAETRPLDGE
ncbi:MAG: hypothetical protein U5K37_04280 [Natrialbaceae archaeon]|nr:hypothetical protein [Natrialbaceae archaeon]